MERRDEAQPTEGRERGRGKDYSRVIVGLFCGLCENRAMKHSAWCPAHAENPVLVVKSDYYFVVVIIIRVPPNSPQSRLLLSKSQPYVKLSKGKWVTKHIHEAGLCPSPSCVREAFKATQPSVPDCGSLGPGCQSKASSSKPQGRILCVPEGDNEECVQCYAFHFSDYFTHNKFPEIFPGLLKV